MIQKINNVNSLDRLVFDRIGYSLTGSSGLFPKTTGSCLYILKEIYFFNAPADIQIERNARCNFELFETGLLLRVNDKQNFFILPLSKDDKLKIQITEGEEKIILLSLTGFLYTLGIAKRFLKKYWLFRGGFYNERFTLLIETENERILLDSQGQNFEGALKYFNESVLRSKITSLSLQTY